MRMNLYIFADAIRVRERNDSANTLHIVAIRRCVMQYVCVSEMTVSYYSYSSTHDESVTLREYLIGVDSATE